VGNKGKNYKKQENLKFLKHCKSRGFKRNFWR